ncbi:MAG TPA: asparagine synthetase B, partial [Blastocatellia bacterium]|nr:asparagine synthetase B [Blastocatellia bacterium]
MCGLVGIVSLEGQPVDLEALQRMNDVQEHRGPDGEGFLLGWLDSGKFQHAFVQNAASWQSRSRPQVALGHRRLAILDLSDLGLQPMTVDDRSTWIVFNGEIYNHVELRSRLEALGCSFGTRTDTEVLLRAYLQWGVDCLQHLEGM